jgi:hypothetical protein
MSHSHTIDAALLKRYMLAAAAHDASARGYSALDSIAAADAAMFLNAAADPAADTAAVAAVMKRYILSAAARDASVYGSSAASQALLMCCFYVAAADATDTTTYKPMPSTRAPSKRAPSKRAAALAAKDNIMLLGAYNLI